MISCKKFCDGIRTVQSCAASFFVCYCSSQISETELKSHAEREKKSKYHKNYISHLAHAQKKIQRKIGGVDLHEKSGGPDRGPIEPPPLSLLSLPSLPLEIRPQKIQLGVWGSTISSHSGVWGGVQA